MIIELIISFSEQAKILTSVLDRFNDIKRMKNVSQKTSLVIDIYAAKSKE